MPKPIDRATVAALTEEFTTARDSGHTVGLHYLTALTHIASAMSEPGQPDELRLLKVRNTIVAFAQVNVGHEGGATTSPKLGGDR